MFEDLLKERKSIRKFKETPIEKDKIIKILECGLLSPSACNVQPYRFIVLLGQKKNEFSKEVFDGIFSFSSFVSKAPVLIVIVRIKTNVKMKIGNFVCDTDFSLIDIGIAGEHMVLKATELGLGSLWVGWFDRKKAKKFLKLSKNESPEIIIAIGEKDENPQFRRKKKFEEATTFME
jgi:nitroreductase